MMKPRVIRVHDNYLGIPLPSSQHYFSCIMENATFLQSGWDSLSYIFYWVCTLIFWFWYICNNNRNGSIYFIFWYTYTFVRIYYSLRILCTLTKLDSILLCLIWLDCCGYKCFVPLMFLIFMFIVVMCPFRACFWFIILAD